MVTASIGGDQFTVPYIAWLALDTFIRSEGANWR